MSRCDVRVAERGVRRRNPLVSRVPPAIVEARPLNAGAAVSDHGDFHACAMATTQRVCMKVVGGP
jgi:hypothetical protein